MLTLANFRPFLVYFELDSYCLCSLQNSILKYEDQKWSFENFLILSMIVIFPLIRPSRVILVVLEYTLYCKRLYVLHNRAKINLPGWSYLCCTVLNDQLISLDYPSGYWLCLRMYFILPLFEAILKRRAQPDWAYEFIDWTGPDTLPDRTKSGLLNILHSKYGLSILFRWGPWTQTWCQKI